MAAVVYGGILAWRIFDSGSIDETAVLLCLPIALIAVTWGLRAGLVAGVAAATPIAVWAGFNRLALSELAAMLLLGGLLGHAIDTLRAAEEDNRRLAEATARYREAVELNDTVVQGLAAAKWALEAGHPDRGLEVVDDTLATAQRLVSDLLRDAGLAPRTAQRPPAAKR